MVSAARRPGLRRPSALRAHLRRAQPAASGRRTSNETNPTKQLPAYWQQDQPPPGGLPADGPAPPPPEGPRSPRWLWIAAGAAVLLVVALVIALITRQRRDQDPDRRPAVARHARAEFGDPDPVDTATHTPRHPGAGAADRRPQTPTETTEPGAMQDRRLQRHRRRSRDQHHVHRHRRRHTDRVQRRAAVEQRGQPVEVGHAPGQRHDRQHRPQRHLLGHASTGFRCASGSEWA